MQSVYSAVPADYVSVEMISKLDSLTCLSVRSPRGALSVCLYAISKLNLVKNYLNHSKWRERARLSIGSSGDWLFRQWSGRPGFNSRLSHTEDSKMLLDAALLSTQHYKVRIKGEVDQFSEWSSAPLHLGVVAIKKGAFGSPHLDSYHQLYLNTC